MKQKSVPVSKLLSWPVILVGLFILGFASPGKPLTTASADRQADVDWPEIALVQVAGGLASPVLLTHAGDGSERLFVVEQAGRIQIIHQGTLSSTPFLDITNRVRSPASNGGPEEGLLSVTFPPQYAHKGYFYVYYTNRAGNNVVARYHLGANADSADAASEETILILEHPVHSNHNGGQLAFGPDGYLYIGTGDGGGGGDPAGNAQSTASLLGKLLRIHVELKDAPASAGPNPVYFPLISKNPNQSYKAPVYLIPPSNPFAGQQGQRGEIWAFGLRNPWRFSFDRLTGDLYNGDVGQDSYEEINFQPADSSGGENYGWNIMEGAHCYNSASCDQSGLVLPVAEYSHSSGNCDSVTGGFVYRGSTYPTLQGIYFYADYCRGKIWGLRREGDAWLSQLFAQPGFNIPSFGEDQSGELYLLAKSGVVYQIVEAP